jgi:hypothetical protein
MLVFHFDKWVLSQGGKQFLCGSSPILPICFLPIFYTPSNFHLLHFAKVVDHEFVPSK